MSNQTPGYGCQTNEKRTKDERRGFPLFGRRQVHTRRLSTGGAERSGAALCDELDPNP